jgi:DNA polymerase-3 subunit gamma/tau
MLGALDQSYLIRVLDALATKDGAGLLEVADEMATRSLSYNAALQDLGTLLHRVALAQTVPAALTDDVPEREDILRLAGLFDAEEVQLFYQIAVHGRNELSLAPDEYAGFSMTLLRMLAFRPGIGGAEARPAAAAPVVAMAPSRLSAAPQVATASAPVQRPAGGMSPARAALEAARNGGKLPAAAPVPQAKINSAPAKAQAMKAEMAPPPWEDDIPLASEYPESEPAGAAAQKKTELNTAPAANDAEAPAQVSLPPTPVEVAAPRTPPRPMQAVASLNWDGNWPALAAALPLRAVAQQLAQQSELLHIEDKDVVQVELRIPLDTLRSAGSEDKLAAALTEHFGKTVRVNTVIGVVEQTANAQAVADREARQREAEENMHKDPFVQTLMREFGATFVPGSIKPI